MTDQEFTTLCSETRPGTALIFDTGTEQVRGSFIGCAEDYLIIEVNGNRMIWPHEVISCRQPVYPLPSYS